MTMIVFTIVFGRIAHMEDNIKQWPYPIFSFAGVLPWFFFQTAVPQSANSVVGSERLITKIYFPRLAIPFASVGAAVVDFCIAFSLLIILMICYRISPTFQMLWAIPVLMLIALLALGMGTLLAALNVAYRDVRYVIPFLIQFWMYATPSIYTQLQSDTGHNLLRQSPPPPLRQPHDRPGHGLPQRRPRPAHALHPAPHRHRVRRPRLLLRLPLF